MHVALARRPAATSRAYARLGRKDDALRHLEMAVENGGGRGMQTDSDLESLRGEPRFQALVQRTSAGSR